tara:strand:+ start:226 stop:483 length:258 start_codon:yes stop_codon:yes gene_type:complete
MSRTQRHIKLQSNKINEESYALHKPTNATFISKKTMETDEEKESIRQESEVVSNEPKLVKNQKTKGQEKKESAYKTMENETISYA